MENEQVVERSPGTYERTERSWPLAFIVVGLVIWMLYDLLPFLWPYLITDYFDIYKVLTLIIILGPILYVIGIAEMVMMRSTGASGRIKFSSIGGVTLLAGAILGSFLLAKSLFQLSQIDGEAILTPLDMLSYVLPFIGVAASLLGAYFSMKRASFRGAMIAGAFSIFSGGGLFVLALIPIALDAKEFDRVAIKGNK